MFCNRSYIPVDYVIHELSGKRDHCFFNELKHEDFLLYNFHPSSEESLICAFYLKSSNNNNNNKDTKKDMSTFQADPV